MHKIKNEYKIKVVKKIVNYVDSYSKVSKPGLQIYTTKAMTIVNKDQTLLKFYDILKHDSYDFDTTELNIYLMIIGLVLNSNNSPNIDQKALKR